ncbi:NifB/NifX family molybdenum-iron cluster-binding protein [Vibrio algarum]|uniref:NifB/NifX family molybdenum-iron cluster-binding protein n=1 Tax=Vibrio algarum TaxID=3020714 RepID=A0ABT4YRH8_9VIBR|nr:NifB/NifX family molybdenum-iron cluster-binding protein [Vibrio sp. KJ40-1]MDB1124163.1 NifB/NifX family molybdenum-iron cluster-binding protein [Vibrio sp. KJ40-1]
MDANISNEAALRLAMATKSLPNVDIKSLIGLLIQHLGEPLSEQKIKTLSPKSFRILVSSLDDSVSRGDITSALAILTNQAVESIDAPSIPELPPIFGPKLRVAITSNHGEMLNGHYGSCMRVLIYEVNEKEFQLVDIRTADNSLKGEVRSDYMLSQLRDCQILFTLSIGGPAAAKVTRASIHPVKKTAPMSASAILSDLSEVIANNPPPWMKKLLD